MAEAKKKKKPAKQKQPKKHACKSKVAVALRRKKIIKDILAGKSHEQAGIDAGLSAKTAGTQVHDILKNPEVQSQFKAFLDKIVPDERLAEKYGALLESKKCISALIVAPGGDGMKDANSMTRDFVEVDDCPTQLKAADSIAKLKGFLIDKHIFPDESGKPQAIGGAIFSDIERANRLVYLLDQASKRAKDATSSGEAG